MCAPFFAAQQKNWPVAPQAKKKWRVFSRIRIVVEAFFCAGFILDALIGAGFLFLHIRTLYFDNSIETIHQVSPFSSA